MANDRYDDERDIRRDIEDRERAEDLGSRDDADAAVFMLGIAISTFPDPRGPQYPELSRVGKVHEFKRVRLTNKEVHRQPVTWEEIVDSNGQELVVLATSIGPYAPSRDIPSLLIEEAGGYLIAVGMP